jgi:hypothetical protein
VHNIEGLTLSCMLILATLNDTLNHSCCLCSSSLLNSKMTLLLGICFFLLAKLCVYGQTFRSQKTFTYRNKLITFEDKIKKTT